MKGSRIAAVGLVVTAALWIGSGHFLPHETSEGRAAVRTDEGGTHKPFRVAVMEAKAAPHSRKLMLSGRTEADRRVTVVARTNGVLTELKVRRGDYVKQGDVIAVLSDEAREAQVAQARALLAQRKAEFDARRQLVEKGTLPRLELAGLEAQYKAAEAALAAAQAELERGIVTAPWSGIVTETLVEVGGAAFSFQGREIAHIVSLDPMLAVAEVSERKLGGIAVGQPAKIRLVTGQTAHGRIRYVAKTASPATRTYRVEVEIKNPDGAIPDGITAEVIIPVAPAIATRVPRSALTFSSAGKLGVRLVDAQSRVAFAPVTVIEDEQASVWVAGVSDGARVIVQGQDFVREGQTVEAVAATAAMVAAQ
jgi:multidrug efflux system membrane fusion protein